MKESGHPMSPSKLKFQFFVKIECGFINFNQKSLGESWINWIMKIEGKKGKCCKFIWINYLINKSIK